MAFAQNNLAKTEIPLSRITLYRSGVASIERKGSVEGNANVDLTFRTEQINDILKSLVVLDLSGGSVGEVTYTSQEPLERRLRGLSIDIADNPPMATLLNRLRGIPVKIKAIDGELSGTVINVETRPTVYRATPGGDSAKHDVPWINLMTDSGIRSANLTDVTGFEILDTKIAADFKTALAAIASQRGEDSKTVGLRFRGTGTRDVLAAYVQEAPVWKTSYRLVLPENDSDKLMLQSWAIVENTSDEDWNNVRLALASGQPSAFQMNLYDPLYNTRPWISVPVPETLVAMAYKRGGGGSSPFQDSDDASLSERMTSESAAEFKDKREFSKAVAAPAPGSPMMRQMGSGGITGGKAMQSIAAAAAGMETGEVFFYEINNPVSIGRQQSAMLPIVSQQVPGRRVSIYNQAQHATHPMRGVQATNDSGLQLIAGPVSVFDDGVYAGDSQLSDVGKGEKRLLAYALDQDVTVKRDDSMTGMIQKVRISKGNFIVTRLLKSTVKFTIDSIDQNRSRTLIIEEPRKDGFELIEPQKASEETTDTYRFEISVPAKGSKATQVITQRVMGESFGVMSVSQNQFAAYSTEGKASQAVKDAYAKAWELQRAVTSANERVQNIEKERSEITTEQDRIRKNMESIERTSELYQKLLGKLTTQENRMDELAEQLKAARAAVTQAEQARDAYINNLEVE
ncbi:MAG: DUF4139 domain-containing protein [Phycisphaerales bacterium]